MERIVRTLSVTSSPTSPSPRVAATARRPASYRRLIARPSNLSSAMYSTGGASAASPRSRRTRASNFAAAPATVSVSVRIDSIGIACRTGAKSVRAAPPTRCVGESGDRRSG